jgi:hypothetical protein
VNCCLRSKLTSLFLPRTSLFFFFNSDHLKYSPISRTRKTFRLMGKQRLVPRRQWCTQVYLSQADKRPRHFTASMIPAGPRLPNQACFDAACPIFANKAQLLWPDDRTLFYPQPPSRAGRRHTQASPQPKRRMLLYGWKIVCFVISLSGP